MTHFSHKKSRTKRDFLKNLSIDRVLLYISKDFYFVNTTICGKLEVMPKVTIYSTTSCPFCKMEKEYLTEKGIKYENIFIDQNPEKAKKLIEESGQMGVPFTEITKDDGTKVTILGFDKQKLNQALGIQG